MKTSIKFMLICVIVISTTTLISWDHLKSKKKLNTSSWSYQHEKKLSGLAEEETNDLIAEEDGFRLSPVSGERVPPAEDVLIKKIPGDNNHLLMMAFYSKENYSGQFVTINK